MKARLRKGVLGALRAGGVFHRVLRSRWRSERLLILCYHGFSLRDEHLWDPGLFVTAEHFEGRLELLRRLGCTIVPLGEALIALQEGTLPPRAVAITVDDGNYDFMARALPALERHHVHATIYVSTYHVADQRPVFNVMSSYLLWRAMRNGRSEVRLPVMGTTVSLPGRAAAWAAAADLRERAQEERWSAADKLEYLVQLSAAAGEDWEALSAQRVLHLMSIPELASLPRNRVDVQLHTHRHRTPRDREQFLWEIYRNREVLAEAGLAPEERAHFCYPSGVHYPEFLPWLRESGVRSATTCVPGLVSRTTDQLLLPRFIDTTGTPALEFEAWCTGVRGVLRRPVTQFSGR